MSFVLHRLVLGSLPSSLLARPLEHDASVRLFVDFVKRLQCEIDRRDIVMGDVIGRGSSALVKRGWFGNTEVVVGGVWGVR